MPPASRICAALVLREQVCHGDLADDLAPDDQINRLRLTQDRGSQVRAGDRGRIDLELAAQVG